MPRMNPRLIEEWIFLHLNLFIRNWKRTEDYGNYAPDLPGCIAITKKTLYRQEENTKND